MHRVTKVALTIACGAFSFSVTNINAGLAQDNLMPGNPPRWTWPLDDNRAASVSQDYAEYNACLKFDKGGQCIEYSTKFHTALDIGANLDTPVHPASAGYVVLFMPNGTKGCIQPNCTDHGDGNTIIIQDKDHPFYYSHYQHMDAKLSTVEDQIENHGACGDPITKDPNAPDLAVFYWQCTGRQFEVSPSDIIGYVGGSGFGKLDSYENHLHFEAKIFGSFYSYDCFNTPACCPQSRCFGYTKEHPTKFGYRDPLIFLEPGHRHDTSFQVQLTQGTSSLPLRLGPSRDYDEQTTWDTGEGPYWAKRQDHQATDGCSKGWYRVRKTPHIKASPDKTKFFEATNRKIAGPGQLPDTWVCRGDGNTLYVEPVQ